MYVPFTIGFEFSVRAETFSCQLPYKISLECSCGCGPASSTFAKSAAWQSQAAQRAARLGPSAKPSPQLYRSTVALALSRRMIGHFMNRLNHAETNTD